MKEVVITKSLLLILISFVYIFFTVKIGKVLILKFNFCSIPLSQILPAPGQGAIAVTYNKENNFIKKICKRIDCSDTRVSLNSERSLIKKINGDCFTPIAALAIIKNGSIMLKARLFSKDYKKFVDDTRLGPIETAKSLGKKCAESLLKKLKTLE